jgi:hypothetical protein
MLRYRLESGLAIRATVIAIIRMDTAITPTDTIDLIGTTAITMARRTTMGIATIATIDTITTITIKVI